MATPEEIAASILQHGERADKFWKDKYFENILQEGFPGLDWMGLALIGKAFDRYDIEEWEEFTELLTALDQADISNDYKLQLVLDRYSIF